MKLKEYKPFVLPKRFKIKYRLQNSPIEKEHTLICETDKENEIVFVYFDGISDTPEAIHYYWNNTTN